MSAAHLHHPQKSNASSRNATAFRSTALKWAPLITCNVIVIIITLICYQDVFQDLDKNGCILTYMYPNFIRVKDPQLDNRYELYLYKEASRETTIGVLKGVPVLFIPGNAGSYKQVRSFGSETYKIVAGDFDKRVDVLTGKKYDNTLDFFAVDFNEEFSALSGDVMLRETEFVNDCIRVILSMYNTTTNIAGAGHGFQVPTTVILVAHSMGGIVARAVLSVPNYTPNTVNTIITLNTAHRASPVYFHRSSASLYDHVNSFWLDQYEKMLQGQQTHLDDLVIVSIAGGHRDSLIRSELTSLDGLVPHSHGLSTLTTSLPDVWLEADHQCILWCQQFLHTMLRAMMNIAQPQNTLPAKDRLAILKKYYVSPIPHQLGLLPHPNSNSENGAKLTTTSTITTNKDIKKLISGAKHIDLPDFAIFGKDKMTTVRFSIDQWIMKAMTHFVVATNIAYDHRGKFWRVFLCVDESCDDYKEATSSVSVAGLAPLSAVHKPTTMPSPTSALFLTLDDFKEYKYVYIWASSTGPDEKPTKPQFFVTQFYNPNVDATFPIKDLLPFSKQTHHLSNRHLLLTKFAIPSHHKYIPLIASISPKYPQVQPRFLPLAYTFSHQPMFESKFFPNASSIKIKFHQSAISDTSYLLFFTDPEYEYEITIQYDWRGVLGQHFKGYLIPTLVGCVIGVALLVVALQVHTWRSRDELPHFLLALRTHFNLFGGFFIIVVPTIGYFLAPKNWDAWKTAGFFADPYLDFFLREHVAPYWVPPAQYMFSISVLTLVGVVTWIIFALFSFISQKVLSYFYRSAPQTISATPMITSSRVVLPTSKWLIFGYIIAVIFLHSSIPLAVALLSLLFITRVTTSGTSPLLGSSTSVGSTSPIGKSSFFAPDFMTVYHHTVFVLYLLLVLLMSGSLLLWIKQIIGGFYWSTPFFDGYEIVVLIVLAHISLAANFPIAKKGLPIQILIGSAGLYVLIYAQHFTYRSLETVAVVSVGFVVSHSMSSKRKNN